MQVNSENYPYTKVLPKLYIVIVYSVVLFSVFVFQVPLCWYEAVVILLLVLLRWKMWTAEPW